MWYRQRNGWEKASPKFKIIQEIDDEFIVDIDGYAIKYAANPKNALYILNQ